MSLKPIYRLANEAERKLGAFYVRVKDGALFTAGGVRIELD